jgi:hypothetical protein
LCRRYEKERFKRLIVAPEILVMLGKAGEPLTLQVTQNALPFDAEYAGVAFNRNEMRFEIIVYSREFPVVPMSQLPDLIDPLPVFKMDTHGNYEDRNKASGTSESAQSHHAVTTG